MRHFSPNDTVVYPTVGVGTIQAIENVSVADNTQPMYVIWFDRQKMTQRVPTSNTLLRGISTKKEAESAVKKLVANRKKTRGPPHIVKRVYDSQLHSGNISDLAELVCNLFVAEDEVRSYTNMQIAEEATSRLVDELCAITEQGDSVMYGLVQEALETKKLPQELKRL